MSVSRGYIADRVRLVIAGVTTVSVAKLGDSKRLIEDVGLDSLDFLDMVMELEEEFDVNVPDGIVAEIKTVGDIVDYIMKVQNV